MNERDYLAEYAAYLKKDLGKNNIAQNLFQRFKELITDGRLPAGYMLEGETASYAAKRATAEDIAQLEYYYEKMKEHRNDVNQFVDYDAMFHMQVANATHNKLLISTMMASKDSFENGIRLAMRESLIQNPRVIDVTIELHGKIIECIKNGDFQNAYTAMREHISYVNLTVKYG